MSENIPKKRGRKSKNTIVANTEKPPPRKRGRKPKGGKIIAPPPIKDATDLKVSNIILHLKCNTGDLSNKFSNVFLSFFKIYNKITNYLTWTVISYFTSSISFDQIYIFI